MHEERDGDNVGGGDLEEVWRRGGLQGLQGVGGEEGAFCAVEVHGFWGKEEEGMLVREGEEMQGEGLSLRGEGEGKREVLEGHPEEDGRLWLRLLRRTWEAPVR